MVSFAGAQMLGVVATLDARLAIYAAIGVVAGIFLFYRGFRMLQFKRLVLNTPFSKIRSASLGLVEVSGAATGPRTIPSGLTGAPCYYYCATAWELKQSGNSRQWKKVAEETMYVPFFVDDSTGRLLVDPQGADLDVHCTFKDEFSKSLFSGRDMFPENVTNFLVRNGIGASGNIRLEERCIEPKYPLFILGTLAENSNRWQSAPAVHLTAPSSSVRWQSSFSFLGGGFFQSLTGISMTFNGASTQIPMPEMSRDRIAAKPADAGIWAPVSIDGARLASKNPQAQAPARAVVAPPALAAMATAVAERVQLPAEQQTEAPSQDAGFDTHPPVVLTKGIGNDPFTISSESQRDVVRALAWKSAACIWGGPLLTLISFYVLSQVLGW
jgi:E3 Ubiquitin ligase